MERKRIEKLVVLLLIGILMPVSLFPFPVHADGLIVVNGDDYLLGINVDLYDTSLETYVNQAFITSNNGTSNYSQYTQTNVINQVEIGTYKYTFVFNKSYVGRVVMQYVVPGSQTTRQFTLFVNGTTAEYYSSRDNRYSSTSTFINNWTLSSAQLVEHDDIESLEQIVDLLTDIYSDTTDLVGASSDQLTELQNIVANTSLANTYLQTLTQLRQFNFPFESFSAVYPSLSRSDLYEYQNVYSIMYPTFIANTNYAIFESIYTNDTYYDTQIIIAINGTISSINEIYNYFNLPDYAQLYDFKYYNRTTYNYGNNYFYIVGWKTHSINSSTAWIRYFPKSDFKYIPIFYSQINNIKNIGTDFALQWGFSNRLLDNLDIIANGTIQSSSASGSLDQTTSQFSDDANDLVTIEESFNDSMNDSLENVSPVFNMGSSFLTSANWVSQQFNRIVNNTPFASLITFGLTLGLGLLIIGKVRK